MAVIYYWDYIEALQNYGYVGVFLSALLCGTGLPVPLPYIAVTFTFGGVLHPALVGVASGLGLGIGGTLFYLAGRGGRSLFSRDSTLSPDVNEASSSRISRWLSRIKGWAYRRGSLLVFLVSVSINPIFAPVAITMGTLRFHPLKFATMCLTGSTIKSLAIAYCGYLGLGALLRWLGL